MKKLFFILTLLLSTEHNLFSQTARNVDSLKKEAEIENLLAQSKNYSNQSKNQWISVAVVIVAGLISFGSAFALSIRSYRLEREKSKDLQIQEHSKATRVAAAELIKKVAQGFHSLTWILWVARHTSPLFEIKSIQEHDKLMNKLYSDIAGAQVMLAAYSEKLYKETEETVNRLYKYDAEVAFVALGLHNQNTKNKAVEDLGKLWEPVYNFALKIPKELSTKLESRYPIT